MHLLLAALLWANWNTAHVEVRERIPVFSVAGKPFFVYGAAFFYERIPRAQWRSDLLAYKALGINTIDLYVMWNWHEPQPGTIDFTGATDPQRDLVGLMKLIHEDGFKVILRPGPVIRNEWRNGGYPADLLRRPEYNMPLHDVLEGRYPATATYQNAHADAAADEWLHNRTHVREAAAWLRTALHAVEPWSHDVVAIALDDDQGAYIDNDTWPAPHWHTYMDWLKATVQQTAGTRVPLFINTFQMKVTASAPVWAWGNWYQSDAYRIGDHDLSQLAFSTALLQTQPALPVMTSEFQAGWLQGADEIAPRSAAPENTTLALHEMLQLGAHGVVNFPIEDTYNPPGWEAPWANAFYAWDAAFNAHGGTSARAVPTATFGALIHRYGSLLATMQPHTDLAIAWLASAYDPAQMSNERIAHLADLTIAQQQRCRALALSCRLIDLRYARDTDLRSVAFLVLPATDFPIPFDPAIANRLRRYGEHLVGSVDGAIASGARSSTGGLHDASLLVSPNGTTGVLDIFNAQTTAQRVGPAALRVGTQRYLVHALTIGAGESRDLLLHDGHVRDITPHADLAHLPPRSTQTPAPQFVLHNERTRVVISADAGARIFEFDDLARGRNLSTTIGAARDDVATPQSPSPRDYIAPYTHPIAAGTFNRPYACEALSTLSVRCTYDAPDLAAERVRFEKTYTLDAHLAQLTIDLTASAPARSISALIDDPALTITWPNAPGATHTQEKRQGYQLLTLTYPANHPVRLTITEQGPQPPPPNPRTSPNPNLRLRGRGTTWRVVQRI